MSSVNACRSQVMPRMLLSLTCLLCLFAYLCNSFQQSNSFLERRGKPTLQPTYTGIQLWTVAEENQSSGTESNHDLTLDKNTAEKGEGRKAFVARRSKRWIANFEKLKNIYDTHGGGSIPPNVLLDSAILPWLKKQRVLMDRTRKGGDTLLTRDEMTLLEKIKFDDLPPMGASLVWEARFRHLVDFHATHGHTQVPKSFDNLLFQWVRSQRRCYQRWKEGKRNFLTAERIEQLNGIGFEFELVTNIVRKAARTKRWISNFQKLKNMYDTHGGVNIPPSALVALNIRPWLTRQRVMLDRARKGEATFMTLDEMAFLEKVDFDDMRLMRKNPVWDARFRELIDFNSNHGHTQVPINVDRRLWQWVQSQRKWYQMSKEGKRTHLTTERLDKLDSIGFERDMMNENGELEAPTTASQSIE